MLFDLDKARRHFDEDVRFADDKEKIVDDAVTASKTAIPRIIQQLQSLSNEAKKIRDLADKGYDIGNDIQIYDRRGVDRVLVDKIRYLQSVGNCLKSVANLSSSYADELKQIR